MAYAAVLSLVQTLEQILCADNNRHLVDEKKQLIGSLLEKASNFQDFLEDSWQISSEQVRCLEYQIRDVTYRGEDLIEADFLWEMKYMLENLTSGLWLGTMDQDLRQVIEEMDSILKEAMKIKEMPPRNSLPANSSFTANSSSNSTTVKNIMVEYDDDDDGLMQLKDRLTGQQSKLQTIPIVGMGGIGKTTLALSIYHDPYIAYRFDTRAWITISQEYSFREILVCLMEYTTSLTDEMRKESDEKLSTHLYKSLKGRRYLVVIDDIWSTKAWDDIKMLFPDDNNGSRIMLTTRLSNVAVYVDSYSPHHQMHFLNHEESWKLLQKKVFLEEEKCPPEFVRIGKKIAMNCLGLPLTIAVVGGILSKLNRTEDLWEHVADNVRSVVTSNDEQCSKILSLSYNYLPHYLKPCFLYMGAFPEDYEIRVSKLIKLWIAKGFLKPIAFKSLDEVALLYLQDLVDRNLILVNEKGSSGKIKSCSIHDLLRDLCLREGHREKFLCVMETAVDGTTNGKRRLISHGIYPSPYFSNTAIKDSLKSVAVARSFLGIGRFYGILSSLDFGFVLLRVLDVGDVKFRCFPEEVLKLYNLRYLAFASDAKLPCSISSLKNLHTLIVHLNIDVFLFKLPLEIWEMPRLRHLCITRCVLPDPPPADGASFLETISVVRDFRCTEENLIKIQNVKKLGLKYMSATSSEEWSFYYLNNLGRLHKLENLKCLFGNSYRKKHFPPKLISFPPNLTKLTLNGSYLPWEKMTLIGSLPKLEVLKMCAAFTGAVWDPIEGEFLRLKYLKMEDMDVEDWRADESHFPSLQRLILKRCTCLNEIPSAIGDIQTLQLTQLDYCSNDAVISANNLKQEQHDMGNDGLEVRIDFKKK